MASGSSLDIPLLIISESSSSERRVSPSWTLNQFKARLEPITGIPASVQALRVGTQQITADDDESTRIASFSLQPYAELHVSCVFVLHFNSTHLPSPMSSTPKLPLVLIVSCLQIIHLAPWNHDDDNLAFSFAA